MIIVSPFRPRKQQVSSILDWYGFLYDDRTSKLHLIQHTVCVTQLLWIWFNACTMSFQFQLEIQFQFQFQYTEIRTSACKVLWALVPTWLLLVNKVAGSQWLAERQRWDFEDLGQGTRGRKRVTIAVEEGLCLRSVRQRYRDTTNM